MNNEIILTENIAIYEGVFGNMAGAVSITSKEYASKEADKIMNGLIKDGVDVKLLKMLIAQNMKISKHSILTGDVRGMASGIKQTITDIWESGIVSVVAKAGLSAAISIALFSFLNGFYMARIVRYGWFRKTLFFILFNLILVPILKLGTKLFNIRFGINGTATVIVDYGYYVISFKDMLKFGFSKTTAVLINAFPFLATITEKFALSSVPDHLVKEDEDKVKNIVVIVFTLIKTLGTFPIILATMNKQKNINKPLLLPALTKV